MRGGGIREQRERREGDEERVLGRSLDEAERHAERRVLRLRQRIEPAEDRSKQLVEAGERQVRLGPDAGRPEDSHPRGPRQLDGPLEQRRLADPRIAVDQERAAAGRRRGDEAGDDPQLPVPAEDPFAGDHRRGVARLATSTGGPSRHGRAIIPPRDGRVQRHPGRRSSVGGEDLAQLRGEGLGLARLAVFAAEEAAVVAREDDGRRAEPLGDRLGAAMGQLALGLRAGRR